MCPRVPRCTLVTKALCFCTRSMNLASSISSCIISTGPCRVLQPQTTSIYDIISHPFFLKCFPSLSPPPQRVQLLLLSPLKELSNVLHADIRQKQLESVLQILQSQGDSLGPGWPLVLGVIGAIRNDQG